MDRLLPMIDCLHSFFILTTKVHKYHQFVCCLLGSDKYVKLKLLGSGTTSGSKLLGLTWSLNSMDLKYIFYIFNSFLYIFYKVHKYHQFVCCLLGSDKYVKPKLLRSRYHVRFKALGSDMIVKLNGLKIYFFIFLIVFYIYFKKIILIHCGIQINKLLYWQET